MINILRKNKELISYSFFSYLDKGLTFLLPLSILYLFQNVQTYNRIEFVYSIAAVVLVVVELGVKGFYFYAYRNSSDRHLLLQNVQTYFNTLLLLYSIASLPLFVLELIGGSTGVASLIAFRALFLMLTGFLSYHNRLNDQPFRLFYISFGLNVASYALFLILYFYGNKFSLYYFFLPQFAVVLGYLISQRKAFVSPFDRALWKYVSQALKFFWPTMLNVLIVQSVANFGKVYAFKFLNAEAMAEISFVLRITLLVQLAHGASLEFLSKSLFTADDAATHRSVMQKYSVMMGMNVLACFALIIVSNATATYTHFPLLSLSSVLFIAYVVLWCYGAYFETFFNKYGRNSLLLGISLLACAVFTGFLWLVPGMSIAIIGWAMIFYAAVYFFVQLFFIKKYKLLQLKN